MIYLLRHTTPAVESGICYGATDLALATSFADEARAVLAALPRVDAVVSSPLSRCRELACYLAERRSLPVHMDDRLREMDFGHWEGRPWSSLPRAELNAWAADFLHAAPHGGESVHGLRQRVGAAMDEWSQRGDSLLVVTHAGVIKAALACGDSAAHFASQTAFGGLCSLLPTAHPALQTTR